MWPSGISAASIDVAQFPASRQNVVVNKKPATSTRSDFLKLAGMLSGAAGASGFLPDSIKRAYAIDCSFGLNPAYQDQLVGAGLVISGTDQAREARIMELPSHTFFIGTLFVPQANSAKGKPHPIVLAFLRSAALHHRS